VIAGVSDEHDIKILCCLMLSKLVFLAPEETWNRLGELTEPFRAIIGHKPKENAVKQELEKSTEAQKGVFKVSIQINKSIVESASRSDARVQSWNAYWDWAANEHKQLRMIVEEELKEKER
jgi:cullin-associated NEDD8-dissociated protein 1